MVCFENKNGITERNMKSNLTEEEKFNQKGKAS